MNKETKKRLRELPIEKLELELKELELIIIKSHYGSKHIGSSQGTKTKLIRDTKRTIAFIKTIINQKKQIKGSIDLCENKFKSKRRHRRMKAKMKVLKKL